MEENVSQRTFKHHPFGHTFNNLGKASKNIKGLDSLASFTTFRERIFDYVLNTELPKNFGQLPPNKSKETNPRKDEIHYFYFKIGFSFEYRWIIHRDSCSSVDAMISMR